ncbi:MAG TPA: hypothetical protein V6C97_04270 [Oculatellaceae cyanobacterium]
MEAAKDLLSILSMLDGDPSVLGAVLMDSQGNVVKKSNKEFDWKNLSEVGWEIYKGTEERLAESQTADYEPIGGKLHQVVSKIANCYVISVALGQGLLVIMTALSDRDQV